MSDNYEESIYNFFKKEENFQTMLKVASHAEKVKSKVVEEFWTKAKDHLKNQLNGTSNNWRVELADRFDYKHCKLWIYKEAWKVRSNIPLVAVAFEHLQPDKHPILGIWLYADDLERSKIIRADLKVGEIPPYRQDGHAWWIKWKHLQFDLISHENLISILSSEGAAGHLKNMTADVNELLIEIEQQVTDILNTKINITAIQ